MILKNYQHEILNGSEDDGTTGILSMTFGLLNSKKYQQEILLKAITGSGKTIVLAEYIKSIYSQRDDHPKIRNKNYVFIWLTVGTGGLHFQSAKKIANSLNNGNIKIICPKEENDFNETSFQDKTIVILNWEKINKLDDSNELSSNLFVGEKNNIQTTIKNSDVEYIFIVDEAHRNYKTKPYLKILSLFNPKVILCVTATPTTMQKSIDKKFNLSTAKVIDEQMIKKGIIYNEGITVSTNDKNLISSILGSASLKRDELEKLYLKSNSNVVPLCLIQLENDNATMKSDVIEYLQQSFVEGVDFAVWLSDESKNKNVINNLESNNIKFLVFKQAIAVGWDCPRSHILVKLRPFNKQLEPFDLQTIGRVLRMPEHKHYSTHDELNYAYIYSYDNKIELDKEVKDAFDSSPYTLTQKLRDEEDLKKSFSLFNLSNFKSNTLNNKNISDKEKIDFFKESLRDIINSIEDIDDEYKNLTIGTRKFKTEELDEFNTDEGGQTKVELSIPIINSIYNSFIRNTAKSFSISENDIKTLINKVFIDNNIINKIPLTEEENLDLIFNTLKHRIQIEKSIDDANRKISLNNERTKGSDVDFKLKDFDLYSSDSTANEGFKNIYTPNITKELSKPEKTFISKLESNRNVIGWYKNKDKGSNALCIVYEYSQKNVGKTKTLYAPTFPDFIVFFKQENTFYFGIYEIKDYDKQEEVNINKENAIIKYIDNFNQINKGLLRGGLVNINQTTDSIQNIDNFPDLKLT